MNDRASAFIERITGLAQDAAGLWHLPGADAAVSYPADAHAAYRDIEDRSFWFRHRNHCILAVVRRYAQSGLFLDLGGGRGFVSRALAESGYPCVMIEPGRDGALAAMRRGAAPVICARFEDLPLPPAGIENCGLFDVLEHIADDAAMLRQIHDCLAPDGRLFLNVPAYQFLYSPEDKSDGHYRRYSRRSVMRVLERSGFDIVYASYIFSPLVIPFFLRRTLPGYFGFSCNSPNHIEADHVLDGPIVRMIDGLLGHEGRRIAAGGHIPFGTSCLCVATRR